MGSRQRSRSQRKQRGGSGSQRPRGRSSPSPASSGHHRSNNSQKRGSYRDGDSSRGQPVPSNASMRGGDKDTVSEMSSTQAKEKASKGRWTGEEHRIFLDSLRKYGKDWYRVEEALGTRSSAQIRSHAQKFLNKLDKEPDSQYDDIKEILGINLRLLKKCEKEPSGLG